MKKNRCVLPFLLLAPGLAIAQQDSGSYPVIPISEQTSAVTPVTQYPAPVPSVDVYYVPRTRLSSKADVDGTKEKGHIDDDGYGIRALVPVGDGGARLGGEYQSAKYEKNDERIDFHEYRLGAGWISPGRLRGGAYAEYLNFDLGHDARAAGFGTHLRAEFDIVPALSVYGQGGYLRVQNHGDAANGYEYLAGVSYRFNDWFGLFADYRGTKFKDDGDSIKLGDARVGVKFLVE